MSGGAAGGSKVGISSVKDYRNVVRLMAVVYGQKIKKIFRVGLIFYKVCRIVVYCG